MKRLELEALTADKAHVESLLATLPDTDYLGRSSLLSRLEVLDAEIAALGDAKETSASVALMFGGEPVFGSRAIDAEFTTRALGSFQHLVDRKIAVDDMGRLGSRGPIPAGANNSKLAITEIVRGSMGFVLEEWGSTLNVADSIAKSAVQDVSSLIFHTAADDAAAFEESIDDVDQRVLSALKEFFVALDDAHATVRIVAEDAEAALDRAAVARGRQRTEATEIAESEDDTVVGELFGILPNSKQFEMRLRGTQEIIKGSVTAQIARSYVELIEGTTPKVTGQMWRVKLKIREVRQRNKPPRKLYTLRGLLEQISDGAPQSPENDQT